ncbi:MAG: ECF transporter S component [Clostridia bacterium]|nr:ECF transporter S component [Clostridia bacterium]
MEKTKGNYFSATRVAVIAMFATLAGVLYAFGFPIAAAFPSWLELNFSDIPALIGTFALGPVSGAIIVFVKILIKLIIKGTSTVFVGELADLLIGAAFVVPSGLIYKKMRTFKGALISMAVGMICSTVMSLLANWLVLVPFYRQLFFQGSWAPLVGTMQTLFGEGCTEKTFYTFYIWCSVLPFNLMRCIIAIVVTLPVYKHISRLINRLNDKLTPAPTAGAEETDPAEAARRKKQTVIVVAVVAVTLLLLVAGVLLRYFLK